jgi:tetratricopeptide (TPR) repeat protein
MESQNVDETQQIQPSSSSSGPDESGSVPENGQISEIQTGKSRRSLSWTLLITISLAALLLIATTSAVGGYFSGINERTNYEVTQVAQQVEEQYQLGLQDMQAKHYDLARQRFEYVIQLDPDYPGVTEQLALVLLEINTTATPTLVPTPTLTPTPDMRGASELFSQSQFYLADGKWTEAIDTLLKLRKDEPEYQTIKVDSMLYVALRNRGVDRILRDGDLEGGTYDLALAEKFGPLDVEANNMRTWADLYKTGASFWGLDWGQSAYYFGQIIIVAPNLRDNTNVTAAERFLVATIKYGDALAANKEWCLAQEQYETAYSMGSDPSIEPTASWVTQKCTNSKNKSEETEPPPPPENTPTPGVAPTEAAPSEPPPPQATQPPATEAPPTQPVATTEPPPEATPTQTTPTP